MAVEWLGREDRFAIQNLGITWRQPLRWSLYFSILFIIILFMGREQQFIYFQF